MGQALKAGSAKAASQTYEVSFEAEASVQGADTSGDQILAVQEPLKDVADASQLSFDDVLDDAKERAADVMGGAEELAADVMDGAKEMAADVMGDAQERAGDVFEGTRNLFEGSGEKAGGVIQDLQSGFGDFVDKLLIPQSGEALQDLVEDAQDKAEDAGDALQDLVGETQDRLESAQDAFKAFADQLTSRAAGSLPSAPEPAPDAGELPAPSVQNFAEEPSAPATPSMPDNTQTTLPSVEEVSPDIVEGTQTTLPSIEEASPDVIESAQTALPSVEDVAPNTFEGAAPSAIEGAQGSPPGLAEEGGQTIMESLPSFPESVSDSVTAAQESVSDAMDAAGATLEAGKAAVEDVLQDAQVTFNSTVSGATGAVENSIAAAKQSLAGIKDGIFGAVHTVQDTLSNTVSSTTKSVVGAGSQVSSQLTSQAGNLLKPLREIGRPLKSAIDQAASGVTDAAARVTQEVEGQLPPEAREALSSARKTAAELSGPLQEVLREVGKAAGNLVVSAEEAAGFNPNDPAVTALLVAGGTLALVLNWWLRDKVGYGGDLTPNEVLEVLQKERQALLVDVRPQRLRDADGIPALKRGARFKQASVEPVKLDNRVRKLVRDAALVEYDILAAKIKGLKNVGSGSTVIVMDDRGATSKEVARAVARTGVKKAYRLDGGYAAWAASQATREDVPEKPVAILKEEAELIAEETGIPAPLLATGIGSGVALGAWAVWEWEKTLQLIALIGIASSVYSRVQTYQSLDDLKADLRLLQRPFVLGGTAIASVFGVAGKAAGSPQLATASGASTEAAGQGPVVDSEEYDDPVVEEEKQKQEAPVPATTPVSTSTGTAATTPVSTGPADKEETVKN